MGCKGATYLQNLSDSLKARSLTHSFNSDSSKRILRLEWNREVLIMEKTHVQNKLLFHLLSLLSPSTVILMMLLKDL